MNQKTPVISKKVQSLLVRPQYSPGLLLNDDDLTQAVDYTRALNRLLFRSLLGCGVICGLRVDAEVKCDKLLVTVKEGIALDCHGDPVHVPVDVTLPVDPTCSVKLPTTLWVVLRRYDKHCAPRSAICSQDDDDAESVCTRIFDGAEISVVCEVERCGCDCIAPTPPPPQPPKPVGETKVESVGTPSAAVTSQPAPEVKAIPDNPHCYDDHYNGVCNCGCCDCTCGIVLAKLTFANEKWSPSHAVRRFIRPVLMTDPVVVEEQKPKT